MAKQATDHHIGHQLRTRRTTLGMSQIAVAKAMGVTFQQIQKYEKGTNRMNASRLHQCARLLKVSVAYFFEGLEQPPSKPALPATVIEFDHYSLASDRESLELMKALKRLKEPKVRKKLADLIRAVAEDI